MPERGLIDGGKRVVVSPGGRRTRLPDWVGFTLAIALVWLGGQFITQGVSDEFAQRNAEIASLWRGDSAAAISGLARRSLLASDNPRAIRLSRMALQRSPLDSDALATLSVAENRLGHAQSARRAMQVAGGLGWRDIVVQIWLLRDSLLKERADAAALHLDAIMRREDPIPPALLRVAELLCHDPSGERAIAARLAMNPRWRGPFFAFLAADPQPGALAIEGRLLGGLLQTRTLPTAAELGPYVARLVAQGRYGDARSEWRRLRQIKPVSLVYNGDFSSQPDGTLFDWLIPQTNGLSAEIDQSPTQPDQKALRMVYNGVATAPPVQELVMLNPGRYRLSFQQLGDQGDASSVMSWTLMCAGSAQVIAHVQLPSSPPGGWQGVAADFSVPPAECPAQWLALSVTPGERPETTATWFRQVALTPVAAPNGGAAQ